MLEQKIQSAKFFNHNHITVTLNITNYQYVKFQNTLYYHITVTLKLIPKMVNISNTSWLAAECPAAT